MGWQKCSYSACLDQADFKATIVYHDGASLEPHYACMSHVGVIMRLVSSIYYLPETGWSWTTIDLLDFPEDD